MRQHLVGFLELFFGQTPRPWLSSVLIGLGMVLVLGSWTWPAWVLPVAYLCLVPGIAMACWAQQGNVHLGPITGLSILVVMVPFVFLLGLAMLADAAKRLLAFRSSRVQEPR